MDNAAFTHLVAMGWGRDGISMTLDPIDHGGKLCLADAQDLLKALAAYILPSDCILEACLAHAFRAHSSFTDLAH